MRLDFRESWGWIADLLFALRGSGYIPSTMRLPLPCVLALALTTGCQSIERASPGRGPDGRPLGSPAPRPAAAPADTGFRVETVARDLQVPWSIAFTPDGRLLFTERPGHLRVIEKGRLRAAPLARIDDVVASGEGGLMGLALHPRFAENRLLYVGYTSRAGDVRVVRYRETGEGLADRRVILEGIPSARVHAGMRLGFGPDGKLYVTTGDAAERGLAQRRDSLAGKTLRLNDDGSAPEDNPFVERSGARPEIWSYGHRNAQGMDWQPGTGLMFQTEHGPSGFDGPGGGDEVNLVERGRNYGWPVIHHRQTREGMV
jgi:glucose/arabinose dehydrogenase